MYKDRGIIKWLPFDALTGFRTSINNLIKERNKVEKPVLLDDQIEILNIKLKEALKCNQEISLIYYEDGYFKEVSGKVTKIDLYEQVLFFNSLKIDFLKVLDINDI